MVLHKKVYSLYAMKVLSSSAAGKTISLYHGKTTFHFFCNSRPVPCLWWAVQRDSIFLMRMFEINIIKRFVSFTTDKIGKLHQVGPLPIHAFLSPQPRCLSSKILVIFRVFVSSTYLFQQFDKDTHQLQMLSFIDPNCESL